MFLDIFEWWHVKIRRNTVTKYYYITYYFHKLIFTPYMKDIQTKNYDGYK